MSSNLPDGVTEQTFGAPWNDQEYIVWFHFYFDPKIDGFELSFVSDSQEITINLDGPKKYDDEELTEIAIDVINEQFRNFLSEYDCEIVIEEINEN